MRRNSADRGSPHGKLPDNALLRVPASTTALALIYRAKHVTAVSGLHGNYTAAAQSKIKMATQRVLSWQENQSGSLTKVTQKEKIDTTKGEHVHAKMHREIGYRQQGTLMAT